MLRHGANMDAGLCPVLLCKRRRARSRPGGLHGARPHGPGERGLGPAGHVSSSSAPPTPAPKQSQPLSPPRLGPRRARDRGRRPPGRPRPPERLYSPPGPRGPKIPPRPHPSRVRLPNTKLQKPPAPLKLPHLCSPWPARNKQDFLEGAKGILWWLLQLTRSARCHGVWKIRLGGGVGGVIGKKNISGWGGICLVEGIWGDGGAFCCCCYLFVSYTHGIFCPSTSVNFPGLGWQKAASLRAVYCSGYGSGGTVIKRQKAKIHSQIRQKAQRHAATPTTIEKYPQVNVGVWLKPARTCFPVLI